MAAMAALAPDATDNVEAAPFLNTVNSVLPTPFKLTMFSCGMYPSRTCATSFILMTVPPTNLIGRSFNRSIRGGLTLRSIGTSFPPIFATPLGKVKAPLLNAVTTSV
jgi:hypothetical protein